MNDQLTPRLSLPLVQPSQAQKHVTVNESFARLDGLVNLVLISITRTVPPTAVTDGSCYAIPQSADGSWSGHGGQTAIASGGGWIFADAQAGQRAFIADQGVPAIFDGAQWIAGAISMGGFGSALCARTVEEEVSITPGPSFVTSLLIPNGAMVIGVTARVVEALTGTLSSWKIGTSGAFDRFGAGLGKQNGSWSRGLLSQPLTYWQPEPLLLSATGGAFAGGKVRLAAHWLELALPS